eukprot:3319203-Prymnesium_polylepis.1
MELRTRTHRAMIDLLPKRGRPKNEVPSKQQLYILSTTHKNQYTAEAIWKSHVMRHHTAKRALSYAVVSELTLAGAQRVVGGLEELAPEALPRLQSPKTDERHDQQLDVIARRFFLEEVALRSPTLISQDEVSKRRKAYTVL